MPSPRFHQTSNRVLTLYHVLTKLKFLTFENIHLKKYDTFSPTNLLSNTLLVKFKNKTMKNLFFLVLICTISKISLAQDYVPFPDTNAYWNTNISSWGSSSPANPIGIIGDTLIDNKTYIKLGRSLDSTFNAQNATFIGGYREENKRYYFVFPNSDSTEQILYDFNLSVNDTLRFDNPYAFGIRTVQVTGIDSILIQGTFRKKYELFSKYHLTSEYGQIDTWIEGIGSTNGIIYSGLIGIDINYSLICFHQNNELVYVNSPNGTCYYKELGLEQLSGQKLTSIFPNPATNQVSIEYSGTPFENYSFEILDQLGRIVVSENQFESAFNVNTNSLPIGIYTYRFLGNSVLLATGKLSVQ